MRPNFKSTWDLLIEEGEEKGIEKGIEIGIEKGIEKGIEQGIKKGEMLQLTRIVKNLISQTPDISDNEIRFITGAEIETIQKIRQELALKKD